MCPCGDQIKMKNNYYTENVNLVQNSIFNSKTQRSLFEDGREKGKFGFPHELFNDFLNLNKKIRNKNYLDVKVGNNNKKNQGLNFNTMTPLISIDTSFTDNNYNTKKNFKKNEQNYQINNFIPGEVLDNISANSQSNVGDINMKNVLIKYLF